MKTASWLRRPSDFRVLLHRISPKSTSSRLLQVVTLTKSTSLPIYIYTNIITPIYTNIEQYRAISVLNLQGARWSQLHCCACCHRERLERFHLLPAGLLQVDALLLLGGKPLAEVENFGRCWGFRLVGNHGFLIDNMGIGWFNVDEWKKHEKNMRTENWLPSHQSWLKIFWVYFLCLL